MMNVIVHCLGDDGEVLVYGGFEDDAWARAWIKQHDHNPYFDEPELDKVVGEYGTWENEVLVKREEDEQHWCLNGSVKHEISTIIAPAFDPTTLPIQE